MQNYSIFGYLLFGLFFLAACGESDSTEDASNDTVSDTTATADATPKEYCFYSEGLTEVSINLRVTGKEIQGFAQYVTPKAGMELYSNYDITGRIENGLYEMTFTRTDSEDKQGLGEQFTENWKVSDGKLIPIEGGVAEQLELVPCLENAKFSQEIQRLKIEENSYTYEGRIGKSMSIKLFLETQTDPEDAQQLLLTGHYYYLSQGPDKTIKLEGVMPMQGMQPAFLYETKKGETFAKFVIEQDVDFSQPFEALFVSADGTKEYPVQLTPQ